MWGCHSPSVDEGLGVDVGAGERQDFAKSGQTGFECTARKNEEGASSKRTRHIVARTKIFCQSVQLGSKEDSKGIQKEFKPQ